MSTHVAMSSSCLFLGSMPEVFRTASELGYDSVEVLVTHQRTTQLTHELLDAVQTYQIPISAIHAPTRSASMPAGIPLRAFGCCSLSTTLNLLVNKRSSTFKIWRPGRRCQEDLPHAGTGR